MSVDQALADVKTLLRNPDSAVSTVKVKVVTTWAKKPYSRYEFQIPAMASEDVTIEPDEVSTRLKGIFAFHCTGCLLKPEQFGTVQLVEKSGVVAPRRRGEAFYELTSGPFSGWGLHVNSFDDRPDPNIMVFTAERLRLWLELEGVDLGDRETLPALFKWALQKAAPSDPPVVPKPREHSCPPLEVVPTSVELALRDLKTLLEHPDRSAETVEYRTVTTRTGSPFSKYEFHIPAVTKDRITMEPDANTARLGGISKFECSWCFLKPEEFGTVKLIHRSGTISPRRKGSAFYEITSGPFRGWGMSVESDGKSRYPHMLIFTAESLRLTMGEGPRNLNSVPPMVKWAFTHHD
jgi:hypothetical protein